MTLFWMHLRKDIKKMTKIIFATGNAGKMREIRDIMADLDVELLSMKEAGIKLDIVEDGKTFEENALIKARAVVIFISFVGGVIPNKPIVLATPR